MTLLLYMYIITKVHKFSCAFFSLPYYTVFHQDEEAQVCGMVVIGNMQGMGWTQAKSMKRNYIRIMGSLLQVIKCIATIMTMATK